LPSNSATCGLARALAKQSVAAVRARDVSFAVECLANPDGDGFFADVQVGEPGIRARVYRSLPAPRKTIEPSSIHVERSFRQSGIGFGLIVAVVISKLLTFG